MNELRLIKSGNFEGIQADFYSNDKDVFMTTEQMGDCLGYSQPKAAISKILERNPYLKNKEFSGVVNLVTPNGGTQKTRVFTEDGVYEVTLLSKTEKAKEFRTWVRNILKSIRQTGAYMTPETLEKVLYNPDTIINIATQLKSLQTEIAQKNQLIGELAPKANYVDVILDNKGLVTITQIAKDYGMSGSRMNKLLNTYGIQYKQSGQWLLYSKYHNMGYTHSKTIDITRSDGRPDIVMETKWTQKGRLFIYELLKKDGILPIIEQQIAS